MEIIVRNLHDQITEKQVDNFFKGVLGQIGVHTFHCQKLKGRGCATITILDAGKAKQFLKLHGQTLNGAKGHATVLHKLAHMGRPVNCLKSNHPPDPYLLLSLKKEESERYTANQSKKPTIVPAIEYFKPSRDRRAFDVKSLSCGQWTYVGRDLAFVPYFQDSQTGRMIFGPRSLMLKIGPYKAKLPSSQIEITYDSVHSFTVGPKSNPSITLNLVQVPKLFETLPIETTDTQLNNLENALRNLTVARSNQQHSRKRIAALNKAHETVVAGCLCYRVVLINAADIAGIQALRRFEEIPDSMTWNTSAVMRIPFAAQMTTLHNTLAGKRFSTLPFSIKFQIQKLAQNGYLEPSKVLELLPVVASHFQKNQSPTTVAESIRNLGGYLPFAGPETDAAELNIEAFSDYLVQNQTAIVHGESYVNDLAEQHDHIASIHKVTITPAGTYLYGPDPETKNRVLRKYSDYLDYFLSVSFLDEDGEPLRLDRQTSGQEIYQGRFKKALRSGINIAGRQYEFLGFSHSSLRSQTCWFMAPFVLNGTLTYAQFVIKNLGDFSTIRSPAKCAARIGQAFSQTLTSISISPEAFGTMDDVERNGRTFSDGVGTCSLTVLQKIWKKYTQGRKLKPTALQIRFQGAKGMISLDTRLKGAALRLRPSMIKFGGTSFSDIEICGSALKPLPMYLNRQLIKILEDLHVPEKAFLDLQADAVQKLRMTTLSSINAASFLQRNFIGKAARLPWLIRKLWAMGFSFADDDFLRNTLELAVLIQLRELKHRSRIRVEKGVTLYGIMDETDFLQEGEVYCFVETEAGGQLLTGSVIITRSPALHPGDVQCVTAVDPPEESPLRSLHNVVVFSSRGQRDLPSQLSGGDLDGDLYNVIYDQTLYPKRLAHPADYTNQPPIDIGRPVERSDMTDFFILFMENDALGLIATLHQVLADQKELGTFDRECILLAEMHSTAVDFSKTGIPVDLTKMPRYPRVRPDFQAPGPRVLVEKTINFEKLDALDAPDEDNEVDELASYGPPKVRYYESEKVLGRLYREIDERKFFAGIEERSQRTSLESHSLVDAVWSYVQDKTVLIEWKHYIEFAEDVMESYEDNLTHTMQSYSPHPSHALMEVEVFAGSILGKNGAQSKRQRENSVDMKEKHERDVAYTVLCIKQGENDSSGEEALERSIACLYVAAMSTKVRKKVGRLVSFAWVAAAVCLKEVEKLPGSDVLR